MNNNNGGYWVNPQPSGYIIWTAGGMATEMVPCITADVSKQQQRFHHHQHHHQHRSAAQYYPQQQQQQQRHQQRRCLITVKTGKFQIISFFILC